MINLECSASNCTFKTPNVPDWSTALAILKEHNVACHSSKNDENAAESMGGTVNVPVVPENDVLEGYLKNFANDLENATFETDDVNVVDPNVVDNNNSQPGETIEDPDANLEKTVNEDPGWFETFRENFACLIIDHCDAKTKTAFKANKLPEDEIEKKRVTWAIMKRVAEYLHLKFAGSFPMSKTLRKVSNELQHQYSSLFRTYDLDDTTHKLGYRYRQISRESSKENSEHHQMVTPRPLKKRKSNYGTYN